MSDFTATPHINVLDDIGFGKTVLMPGDPLRSKFIAEIIEAEQFLRRFGQYLAYGAYTMASLHGFYTFL